MSCLTKYNTHKKQYTCQQQKKFERQYPQESKKKMKKAKGEVDVYKDAAGKAKRGMEEGREKKNKQQKEKQEKFPVRIKKYPILSDGVSESAK